MQGNEIRNRFLNYFKLHSHAVVDSSSLVPKDDPTLLFTNAGMVQFKTVFMGEGKRDYAKAVTSQRCVRAGGKHNDLENVGYTARHHTFFEMLGNFSFGDYFKEGAIHFAWDFLTVELGLDPKNLWVSVYEDDDEAEGLWQKIDGLTKKQIVRMGAEDNFWAMGDTGPCGPCSEIYIDQGEVVGCDRPDCAPGCDCDRYLELWNLVFMQFNRLQDGTIERLPQPSIDTGMGLERVAAILQGKYNNYDSDLFTPIIAVLERQTNKTYGDINQDDTAMRVIADHARATTFLVADGVLPSNEGRGYVLRRIMRRAVRYGKCLGLDKPFMEQATGAVVTEMIDAYPHLGDATPLLIEVVNNEEDRFRETLENGLALLDDEMLRLTEEGSKLIPGNFIFKLYDTYGFPFDVVRDIALEKGLSFDEAGFLEKMVNQREKSRTSRKDAGIRLLEEGVRDLATEANKTAFVGYDMLSINTRVEALLNHADERVDKLLVKEIGRLFVLETPFYAEAGGQVGDIGVLTWDAGRAKVTATSVVAEGIILHTVEIEVGTLVQGTEVTLSVAMERRRAIETHHSATHLLHAALREVLGEHVKQAGSLVSPDRLRFDFTHFTPLSSKEIEAVEYLVNDKIWLNLPVVSQILSKEEALKQGATALFGEKYEESVRVVSMGGFSKELCGGTHVGASGEIAVFKICSENGIASGVRRIEALAGRAAFGDIHSLYRRERQLALLLNVGGVEEIAGKVARLVESQKSLQRRVAYLSGQLASSDLEAILKKAVILGDIRVIAAEIPLDSPKTLRELGDKIRDNLQSGVAVLGGIINGKAALLAIVSGDIVTRIKAGDLVNKVAKVVGGKGGGRPDMAQAGGPMADKLSEAIRMVPELVEDLLQ